VFGNLARAVRTESNLAVGYWFGVTPQTVSKWRKGLGVGLTNPGTHRLRSDHQQEPWAKRARKKAVAKAGDPERRRKIAEARRGKPRPPHVIEAMRAGRTGKPHSAATRAKMRAAAAARLARGVVPNGRAWTREEDEVVLTLPTADAARRTGRTVTAVYKRRRKLRRAAGGMSAGPPAG
jgi:hypothetical protein